jgi:hypothetical protein
MLGIHLAMLNEVQNHHQAHTLGNFRINNDKLMTILVARITLFIPCYFDLKTTGYENRK